MLLNVSIVGLNSLLLVDPPDNEGGSPVVEYAVLITNPDNSSREAYRGNDLSCIIAGLHPGELYLVQVRAINKAGVRFMKCIHVFLILVTSTLGLHRLTTYYIYLYHRSQFM